MIARILLADSHPLFRDGLAALLCARGFSVIAQAADKASAVECARQLQPDLILVDLSLPGLDGMVGVRQLAAAAPHARIILLMETTDHAQFLGALKSGVRGGILKDTATERFLESIEDVARGYASFSPELASVLLQELVKRLEKEEQRDRAPHVELSERERQILTLVAQGLTNRQMAAHLNLSENTIKYHLKNILQKMHLRTRAQAVALAVQKGLLNAEL